MAKKTTAEEIKELRKEVSKLTKLVTQGTILKGENVCTEPKKKEELEFNEWYKDRDGRIVFVIRLSNDGVWGYGMGCEGRWIEEQQCLSGGKLRDSLVPVTDKEVEEMLINEAKKRGFKYKSYFKEIKDSENGGIYEKSGRVGSSFRLQNGVFYTTGHGLWCIFKDGKWAEIVESKLELNGKEVTIEDGRISIGCVKDMELEQWKTFVRILEHTGCDLTHSDIGDIKLSDLKKLLI